MGHSFANGPFSKDVFRAEFHEVTKFAIIKALSEFRDISENRVKAQIVRRIEDRWIGFELSQILQKVFKNRNLSAGRAQTPTLGWIIQRYKEHLKREDITLIEGDGIHFRIEGKVGKPGEAKAYVKVVAEEYVNAPPPPPFTTDDMLKEANRVLKLGASETMSLAQNLFEAGLITYHRTDSHRVSEAGLRVARVFLDEKFRPRVLGRNGRSRVHTSRQAHDCR